MKYFALLSILIPFFLEALSFEEIKSREYIYLYAGDVPETHSNYKKFIGLSLTKDNQNHIKHDVTKLIPLEDNTVDIYQSEDVFEHIEYHKLPSVLDEIYRVLKVGGFCRISVPDYRCDVLYKRSHKNAAGKIFFDPNGGGRYVNGKVVDGGHLWFPVYESVKNLLSRTKFHTHGRIDFLQYYNERGKSIIKKTDYSECFVKRTPDFDIRVKSPRRVMSIVVDLFKE